MDAFNAFVIWTVVTCGIAFGVGKYLPQQGLARDIAQNGEMVISDVVYQCKATHLEVGGKRAPL